MACDHNASRGSVAWLMENGSGRKGATLPGTSCAFKVLLMISENPIRRATSRPVFDLFYNLGQKLSCLNFSSPSRPYAAIFQPSHHVVFLFLSLLLVVLVAAVVFGIEAEYREEGSSVLT